MQESKTAILWDLDKTVLSNPFYHLHINYFNGDPLFLGVDPELALERTNRNIAAYQLSALSQLRLTVANWGNLNINTLSAMVNASVNTVDQFINTGRENQKDWVAATESKIKELELNKLLKEIFFCPCSLRRDPASGKMIGVYDLLYTRGYSKILHVDDCLKTATKMARICERADINPGQVTIAYLGSQPKKAPDSPHLMYTPDPQDAIEEFLQ